MPLKFVSHSSQIFCVHGPQRIQVNCISIHLSSDLSRSVKCWCVVPAARESGIFETAKSPPFKQTISIAVAMLWPPIMPPKQLWVCLEQEVAVRPALVDLPNTQRRHW